LTSGGGGDKQRLKPLGSCKSKVWKYFGFPVNDAGIITDKTEVYCTLCYHRLSHSGNTTNLFYHLEAKHKSQFSKVSPKKKIITEASEGMPGQSSSPSPLLTPKRATINAWFDNSKPYTRHSSRYQHYEDAVIEFICKDLQPLCIVDSPPSLKLVGTLDPRFHPPSRSTVTRVLIPQKYEAVKEQVVTSISKANYCSLTTDLCHRRATAHYITPEWEMSSNKGS